MTTQHILWRSVAHVVVHNYHMGVTLRHAFPFAGWTTVRNGFKGIRGRCVGYISTHSDPWEIV